jgi:hypothetical protein
MVYSKKRFSKKQWGGLGRILQPTLFKPKIKLIKSLIKKIKGPYINWCTFSFWPSIYLIIKQY